MRALSVSELNEQIKSLLESHFTEVWVEGEVSRPTYHTSGHLYFSLKDASSVIKCVMFRSDLAKVPFRVEEGQKLIVHGRIGIYKPRGEYQLYAKELLPSGVGSLQLAFEQLKKRLAQKGYFDESRKKEIPPIVHSLALVTSQTGAALQDMLRIINKRWPLVKVYVIDTLVQGGSAAPMIADAIAYADRLGVDVIIVGRGGGSLEDLWAFNEEVVADAIFAATTPIVSAVGHEIDFLISDFVADKRAPTPSAAIEMVLPDRQEMLLYIDTLMDRMQKRMHTLLLTKEQSLHHLTKQLEQLSPLRKLLLYRQEIETIQERFKQTIQMVLEQKNQQIPAMMHLLKNAQKTLLQTKAHELELLSQKMQMALKAKEPPFGSAQIVKNGKPVALENIEVGDEIELQDLEYRLKAKVVSKDAL